MKPRGEDQVQVPDSSAITRVCLTGKANSTHDRSTKNKSMQYNYRIFGSFDSVLFAAFVRSIGVHSLPKSPGTWSWARE